MAKLGPSGVIALGMAIGQGTTFLITPLLGRLYSPSDMGEMALFLSAAASVSAVATLRLEYVVSGSPDGQASAALRVSLLIAFVTSVCAGSVWMLARRLSLMDGFLMTLTIFSMSLVAVMLQAAARRRKFVGVAAGRAALGLGQSSVQVGGGILGYGLPSLLGGVAAGYLLNALFQLQALWGRGSHRIFRSMSWRTIRALPWLNTLQLTAAAVANVLTTFAPTYFLVFGYGTADAGQYSMAQRIAIAPVGLMVAAIAPVVVADVAQRSVSSNPVWPSVSHWIKRTTLLAVPMALILLAIPDSVLLHLFGEDFSLAVPMLRASVPLIFAQMLLGPLAQVMAVCGWAKAQFAWDVLRLLMVFAFGVIVMRTQSSPVLLVSLYSIILAAFYGVHLYMIFRMDRLGSRGV